MTDGFGSGGTERQVVQLLRLLQASGQYRPYLACHQKRGEVLAEAERLGLGEILEYPLNSFYDRNFLIQLRRCVRFLKANEIDVVHTHDFYTNIFGMLAAWLAGVPARIASKRETEGFRNPMQKRAERYAFGLANSVITNANAVRTQLVGEGVRAEKLLTIYNGLNTNRVEPENTVSRDARLSMFDLPSANRDRRFVTIVANLEHAVKDHSTFLRAAARVRRAVPEASFLIAGQGVLTESLRAEAKGLEIADTTFFLGHCERIAELLALSEVGVLSSQAEGFSNSILEYMAAGLPVVVTDVGGAREAVSDGESGFIVPARDDEAMAARIIMLLDDPERARVMGARGRLIVKERFSCEAQLEQTVALYDRLLAKPSQALKPMLNSLHDKRA
jgi:glycosyltransferase involved in cell wall biosynthesis